MFESKFQPSDASLRVLRDGNIIDPSESGADMVNRIVAALAKEESRYSSHGDVMTFSQNLGERLDDGRIIMSTPVMTNAGRYLDRPLSACTMPTSDLSKYDPGVLKHEIDMLHQQGMGTGFDLNSVEEPVEMLHFLNDIALQGSKREEENRPVGNMAVLSVYHPKVLDFINSKVDSTNSNTWKFNISVDVDDAFFQQLEDDGDIELLDGTRVSASHIFNTICEAAKQCADPGLLFMDRMNNRNPVPLMGRYKTTAPCAEVGLVEGESCQFGYVNLGKFIKNSDGDEISIDYGDLEDTVRVLTRALDDALSKSIDEYMMPKSVGIMQQKRKIGIGISGVADAISLAGLSYSSSEARSMVSDMLDFINYTSKLSSVQLAEERGPALAMHQRVIGNRYFDDDDYLSVQYGSQEATSHVQPQDWIKLGKQIKETGLLRNTTTVALPPTGRSALIHGASTGVEPHFSLDYVNPEILSVVTRRIGGVAIKDADESYKDYLACARDITPDNHIAMVAALQKRTDEAISKTVNMSAESEAGDVHRIYRRAYDAGLSGITVYVDGSHSFQPIK